MIKHLGHNFIEAKSVIYQRDYVCNNCKIRVSIDLDNNQKIYSIYMIEGYINDNFVGTSTCGTYNLSCKEQLIKNLLE